jgi:hypothetical protein
VANDEDRVRSLFGHGAYELGNRKLIAHLEELSGTR